MNSPYITNITIEILEQAHNPNKPTRALNCLNTQNAGRSINSHNMNKLQSALQQLDIEHPEIVDNNLINYLHLYPDIIAPVACLNSCLRFLGVLYLVVVVRFAVYSYCGC